MPPQGQAGPPPQGYYPPAGQPQPGMYGAPPKKNVVGGFFKDLKNELTDVARSGKNKVQQRGPAQQQGAYAQPGQQPYAPPMQAAPPPMGATGAPPAPGAAPGGIPQRVDAGSQPAAPAAAPRPEVYPGGILGAPPPPPDALPERVLLKEASSHVYPQGNTDNGMAVLTNFRILYFQQGFGHKLSIGTAASPYGKFVFDLPLSIITDTQPLPVNGRMFLSLATADGRRFPLYFERIPQWQQAIEDAKKTLETGEKAKPDEAKAKTEGS